MTAQRTILVVEDDAKIADMLTNYLHANGYATAVCANGWMPRNGCARSIPPWCCWI